MHIYFFMMKYKAQLASALMCASFTNNVRNFVSGNRPTVISFRRTMKMHLRDGLEEATQS